MDVEKLIHCLQCCARVDAHNVGCDNCGLEYCGPECQQLCGTAATALSTLQAENAQLRVDLEYEREHANAYYEECGQWEAENEKLRNEVERQRRSADDRKHLYENAERAYMKVVAELEQVKRCIEIVEHQRDAAIYDMTALMAGQCCDLCAVEYCNDRGKTEMCTAFKWRGPEKED